MSASPRCAGGSAQPRWHRGAARGLLIALLLSFGPAVSDSFARFAYALLLPAMRSDLHRNYAQSGSIDAFNAAGYLVGAPLARARLASAGTSTAHSNSSAIEDATNVSR